ncbi:MAG: hypothetical protein VW405_14385 [Rhodospirillaceae bacterium]
MFLWRALKPRDIVAALSKNPAPTPAKAAPGATPPAKPAAPPPIRTG